MKILVINAGSSSIKYALFKFPSTKCLLKGTVEKIGEKNSLHHYSLKEQHQQKQILAIDNHQQALKLIVETLAEIKLSLNQLDAIAHRVVHGGEIFQQPTVINAKRIEQLKQLIPLAPLHNPANILGIETAIKLAPTIKQIAIFDTAFHHTLPEHAARYPIPDNWYQQNIRRYGFHGTSHAYVAKQTAKMLDKPLKKLNLISLHLGNGASACAIQQGASIDTSMGFTPQEGLMMGTRCGDIDSSVYPYLAEQSQLPVSEINRLLNQESGLKGIAGTNDMREIHTLIAKGDEKAKLAFNMCCYRIKKYIGAYYAALGRLDALIFTGGIGENDEKLRAKCCHHLENLGLLIHPKKNQAANGKTRFIHHNHQKIAILVVKTDEELEIAQQAIELLSS
ncbi:MAG: acetate/propionate family kinase [Methylococcaceae bacterium]|nr:acetate/propionate family kinase [Methylococcaceae bacterium]